VGRRSEREWRVPTSGEVVRRGEKGERRGGVRQGRVVRRQVWATAVGHELYLRDEDLHGTRRDNLSVARCVQGTFLGVFASFVVLSEIGIARLLLDRRRWRRRSVCRLAGVYAGLSLALGDEVRGALVGNNLKIVRSTGDTECVSRALILPREMPDWIPKASKKGDLPSMN